MNKRGGFIGDLFTVVLLPLIFMGLCIVLFFGFIWLLGHVSSPAEGEHTGVITATETTGFFWKGKTVYIKTDAQSTQEENYCVLDEGVFEQLKQASKSRAKVTVQFENGYWISPTKCASTMSIITAVAVIE